MKRLITDTGGRPVKNEDLQLYIQSFSIIEGFMAELSITEFIVFGCVITGTGPYNVSSGVIFHNGKLCSVGALIGTNPPGFTYDISVTEGTPRTFFDGITNNTIETTAMTLVGLGGVFDIVTAPRFSDFLKTSDEINTIVQSNTMQDRGDPSASDFILTDFTLDDTWRDLDLSSIIPIGAKFALINLGLSTDGTAGDSGYFDFRKNGNSNTKNIVKNFCNCILNAHGALYYANFQVALDTNRFIEYKGVEFGGGFFDVNLSVTGWSF